jgi:multidrug efflux system membrane fusion protein
MVLDGKSRAPAPGPVPVAVAKAELRDVPVFRTGIGSVVPRNMVTVRFQVDGVLQNVAFTEGQTVKVGDVLAQIDPRPFKAALAAAEAAQAKDAAQLVNARLDLARYNDLVKRDFATRQSVDTQKALVDQFEAAVQGDAAQIDTARIQLGYATVTSPIQGRTGIRLVDAGNVVHAADAGGLVVITEMQPITVVFTLPQEVLPDILRGQAAAPLVVEVWSSEGSQKLDTGTLILIDNQIDQSTGTVKLKALFANQAGLLWPGQFINAHLILETRHDAVTVPEQAVQRGPEGTFVWTVEPDSTVTIRPVTIAQVAQGTALVTKGLEAGQTVVTDGQFKLLKGLHVQFSAPASAPDNGGGAGTTPGRVAP